VEFQCSHPQVPATAENLCVKAAQAFAAASGVAPHWSITLEKRIPVAAGCGGGSSDAAAVLALLNRWHPDRLSPAELIGVARALGADVPYFLEGGAAKATGIGEILEPVPSHLGGSLLLFNPLFPISAAWAYQNWARVARPGAPELAGLLAAMAAGDAERAAAFTYNVFEAAIYRKFPLLAMIAQDLRDHGAWCARISGSGPTLFAMCDQARAKPLLELITARYPGLWSFSTAFQPQ
jgi:4-diphosphocytidyl-2-C-methyl-D-erythritol kinase